MHFDIIFRDSFILLLRSGRDSNVYSFFCVYVYVRIYIFIYIYTIVFVVVVVVVVMEIFLQKILSSTFSISNVFSFLSSDQICTFFFLFFFQNVGSFIFNIIIGVTFFVKKLCWFAIFVAVIHVLAVRTRMAESLCTLLALEWFFSTVKTFMFC